MRVLHKKLFRSFRRAPGQTIAVVAVILCGVASYVCVQSAYYDLLLTRDTYYRENRFADFEIQLERVPESRIQDLERIPGVRQVRGRIVVDVKVDIPAWTKRAAPG